MIVVSGMARSGTSMMMQTLIHLGLDSPAPDFLPEHKLIKDKNPKGFYELYNEVSNGVHHDMWKGKAVKLFPGCLNQTPKEYVSKVIIMLRDKSDTIKSYAPIHKILKEDYTPEVIFDANYYILDNYTYDVDHIFVNFEDIISNPEKEIERVVEFLNLERDDERVLNAINNIELCHY